MVSVASTTVAALQARAGVRTAASGSCNQEHIYETVPQKTVKIILQLLGLITHDCYYATSVNANNVIMILFHALSVIEGHFSIIINFPIVPPKSGTPTNVNNYKAFLMH